MGVMPIPNCKLSLKTTYDLINDPQNCILRNYRFVDFC